MNNWDKYRANEARAKAGGPDYRKWSGGKGDVDRSSHLDTYQLGMQLIDIAEKHGQDSDEYQAKLLEWQLAVQKASKRNNP
jgi:hypothetical protein